MSDTGEYRAHAAECVRLAQQTNDPQSKGSLLDMARAWLALVNQGQKKTTTLRPWSIRRQNLAGSDNHSTKRRGSSQFRPIYVF